MKNSNVLCIHYLGLNHTVGYPVLKFSLYVITRQTMTFVLSTNATIATYHKIRIRVYHYKILKCIIFHEYIFLLILSNKWIYS